MYCVTEQEGPMASGPEASCYPLPNSKCWAEVVWAPLGRNFLSIRVVSPCCPICPAPTPTPSSHSGPEISPLYPDTFQALSLVWSLLDV